MAIHLHRSNRSEGLVQKLCEVLQGEQAADPFVSYPIVVGSRGMERWLRHQIATRNRIAAGLSFPFPRQALGGAAWWLLNRPEAIKEASAQFWETPADAEAGAAGLEGAKRWERRALAFQLVGLLRGHADDAAFEPVTCYLADGGVGGKAAPVTPRELLFAGEVGDVLDRLMHDRPKESLSWALDPGSAPPEHRWLATLLADLGAATDAHSPAVLHQRLIDTAPAQTRRSICIFGLSTMGRGDRDRLTLIARSIDVHLFVLVPTDQWFNDLRTPGEGNAARRRAKDNAERAAIEAEIESDNPLLKALGAPSRDLQGWLEDVGYQPGLDEGVDPVAAPDDAAPGLLHRMQRWILAAEPLPAEGDPWPVDPSISLLSTYGPLRQCEVLRDALLQAFADDPTLKPRDVVIMTPDIGTFAPLVAAVFARRGRSLPQIPVSIADLGLSQTNAVAQVLLKVLESGGAGGVRLTANWLLDFMALGPVRQRWGIEDDDLGALRQLVQDSGLRWGVDAGDRASVGQPALDQNTARFAIERMALGTLMADEGGLDVVAGVTPGFSPAVPLDIQSRERRRQVGALTGIVRALAAHRALLSAPGTMAQWHQRLQAALDALTETTELTTWLRAEVDHALAELLEQSAGLAGLEVEGAAILRWIGDSFEVPQRGDRAITGAVQVCALEPMRSVPFRIVALLGMDDGDFPRGSKGRTWDPMEQRQTGERDRRETDRHLMLEAILSARQRLILLWSGNDVQRGDEQPAAVPVEELLEVLGRLTGQAPKALVQRFPLQPWSAANFPASGASFDHGMALAARRLRAIQNGQQGPTQLGLLASGQCALPEEMLLPDTLALADLVNGLLAPHRLLLQERLGLSVSYEAPVVKDREPLELDVLDSWNLRNLLANELLSGGLDDVDDAALLAAMGARLAGEGSLPMRAGGKVIMGAELAEARQVVSNLKKIGGEAAAPLELSVDLNVNLNMDGAPKLTGRIAEVLAKDGQYLGQWLSVSKKANSRLRLSAWVHLLAAVACGHPMAGARLVGVDSRPGAKAAGGDFLVFDGDRDAALGQLADLVTLWLRARHTPLPLFKRTSDAIARVLAGTPAALDAVESGESGVEWLKDDVVKAWSGDKNTIGDMADPWIRAFYVDFDPTEALDDGAETSLAGLARRVWLPIYQAIEVGKARQFAGLWQQGAGQ